MSRFRSSCVRTFTPAVEDLSSKSVRELSASFVTIPMRARRASDFCKAWQESIDDARE